MILGPEEGMAETTFSVLSEDGKNVQKKGRAAVRKEEAAMKTAERKANLGGTDIYARGSSMRDKHSAALLAQNQMRDDARHSRESILSHRK